MEHKALPFELKDMNYGSRTAIIAHAAYGNIDRTGDISTKGMFTSSWERKGVIDFLFNHDPGQVGGNVTRTYEDENKAYTEVRFGNWKLGDDLIAMIDAGVMKGASFGYETEKKEYIVKDGKKIRVLKQVKHIETSLLTKTPANPLTGIVSLTKAEDIQNFLNEIKSHINQMENFCHSTNASDETIKAIYAELKAAQDIIQTYDTASTPPVTDGEASKSKDAVYKNLLLLNSKFN